jgi:hypothetical protein
MLAAPDSCTQSAEHAAKLTARPATSVGALACCARLMHTVRGTHRQTHAPTHINDNLFLIGFFHLWQKP